MKGVSPVVATVLLIAIAVVAAIGVWFWVAGLQNKPATPAETKMLQLEACIRGNTTTTLVLRNPTAYQLTVPASGVKICTADYSSCSIGIAKDFTVGPYATVTVNTTNGTLQQGAVYYMVFSDEAGNLPSIKILCQ